MYGIYGIGKRYRKGIKDSESQARSRIEVPESVSDTIPAATLLNLLYSDEKVRLQARVKGYYLKL